MPFYEYEAKVYVPDPLSLIKRLKELQGQRLRHILQLDSYYDLNFRLTKKDELLRIRVEQSIETQKFLSGEFSWKSGRIGQSYEVREDISVPLDTRESAEILETILFRLGFRKVASLTKDRERWKLGFIEFELDKNIQANAINRPLLNIGSYLQATIETEHQFSPPEIEDQLWTALEQLGFDRAHLCWDSYIELYLKKLSQGSSIDFSKKREL
ncbi:MAG: class IV adenylate cyclase [Candidatus Helarchaeota archaeon]